MRRLKATVPSQIAFVEATCGEEALARASETKFDIIILDENMPPGRAGSDVMRELRSRGCDALIIGLSGANMRTEHREAGAELSWCKPMPDNRTIKKMIGGALAVRRKKLQDTATKAQVAGAAL